MRVERLEVVDFRNHDRAAVELPAGVSVLVGANGVGKTNLLEAAEIGRASCRERV